MSAMANALKNGFSLLTDDTQFGLWSFPASGTRPYRRLVEDIPLRYVGFTVPDELFAGYGLGLDERWRALPDLHLVVGTELPEAASEAA